MFFRHFRDFLTASAVAFLLLDREVYFLSITLIGVALVQYTLDLFTEDKKG